MRFSVIADFSDQFIEELKPLLELHYREVAVEQDIPLDPDWDWYKTFTQSGNLRPYLMRTDEGRLVGYAFYIVCPNRHYKSSLQASADVVYCHPDFRRNVFSFIRFMQWCDQMLKELGVVLVYHRSKVHVPALGEILRTQGYVHVENGFSRRL